MKWSFKHFSTAAIVRHSTVDKLSQPASTSTITSFQDKFWYVVINSWVNSILTGRREHLTLLQPVPTRRKCVSLRAPHSCGDWSSDASRPSLTSLQPTHVRHSADAGLAPRAHAHPLPPDVSRTVISQPVCQTRVGVLSSDSTVWWREYFHAAVRHFCSEKLHYMCILSPARRYFSFYSTPAADVRVRGHWCVAGEATVAFPPPQSQRSRGGLCQRRQGRELSFSCIPPADWRRQRRLFEINPLWRESTDLCVMAEPERTYSTTRQREVRLWTFKPRLFEIQTVSSFIDNCFHANGINA